MPVDEAKKQLSFKYLHLKYAKTGILDAFFDTYLKENKKQDFLNWVKNDYDPEKLVLSNRRVFSKDIDYYPDGLAVDKNGCVWSAKWDGGCIVKYSPDGKVEKIIDLPIKRPTSIVFGGKDFKSLFITSACLGLDIQNNHSLNGSILEVDSGTNGAQERMFSL